MIQSHYFHFTKAQLTEQSLNDAGFQTQGIIFSGRTDTWSLIDGVTATNGNNVYTFLGIFGLFENDYWGDEAEHILAYFDYYSGDNTWKEIDGTYDDIITALVDNEIILYHDEVR